MQDVVSMATNVGGVRFAIPWRRSACMYKKSCARTAFSSPQTRLYSLWLSLRRDSGLLIAQRFHAGGEGSTELFISRRGTQGERWRSYSSGGEAVCGVRRLSDLCVMIQASGNFCGTAASTVVLEWGLQPEEEKLFHDSWWASLLACLV